MNFSETHKEHVSAGTPKISVIVPVYKVEKYLAECIESVLAQTFRDFELILVDDGSPDNCGKICDDYAARDSRVRVFHKPNGGVSSARNLGIDHARGEWIAFVDPDDWIEPTMYEKLYAAATDGNADWAWCGFFSESRYMLAVHDQRPAGTDSENIIRGYLSGRLHGSVCTKLIRADALRGSNLYFPANVGYCEDLYLSILLAHVAPRAVYVPELLYHYRSREDAATAELPSRKQLLQWKTALCRASEILSKNERLKSAICGAFCNLKLNMLLGGEFSWKEIAEIECANPAPEMNISLARKKILNDFDRGHRFHAKIRCMSVRFKRYFSKKIKAILFAILRSHYAKGEMQMKLLLFRGTIKYVAVATTEASANEDLLKNKRQ